jgi:hypothetical protein
VAREREREREKRERESLVLCCIKFSYVPKMNKRRIKKFLIFRDIFGIKNLQDVSTGGSILLLVWGDFVLPEDEQKSTTH